MRAGPRLFGRRLGSFFIAAASALTIFLAAGVLLDTFSSLGGVQLTQAEGKDKPKDKCKPKDGDNTDNNNGSGGGQPNKKPCPTPSPTPSPTCSPGGYGTLPGCPTPLPPVAGGSSSGDGPGGIPGTEVLGGTTVAQGDTSTTGAVGATPAPTGAGTDGSATSKDTRAKGKGAGAAGSAATGGSDSGSGPETVVLGETITRPEGSDSAAGRSDSPEGTEFLGLVVPLEGVAFGLTALVAVALIGLFFLLLIKRRKHSNYRN
jgi:hypothetical protein